MCGGFIKQATGIDLADPLNSTSAAVANLGEGVSDAVHGVGSAIAESPVLSTAAAALLIANGVPPAAAAALVQANAGKSPEQVLQAAVLAGAVDYGVGQLSGAGTGGPMELGSGSVPYGEIAQTGLTEPPVGASGLFSTLSNSLSGSAGQQLLKFGLQGLSGYGAVDQARNAANQQASDTVRAAQIAADAAKFRPVGVTTRFGASNFQYDPQGNLVGAGYQVAPALAGLQDRLLGQATAGGAQSAQQAQQAQQSLFNLGQQYLAQSPEQAAQQYMDAQLRLLQPSRDVGLAQLRQGMFNAGRTGLSVAQGGDLGAANPEAQAYYNSLAQQDRQLALDALTKGQQQVQFGANLFGQGADVFNAGLKPMQSAIGTAGTIENLGQNALDLGSALGGRVTQGNQAGAAGLLTAGSRAADIRGQANAASPNAALLASLANNPQFVQAGQDAIGGLFNVGKGIYNDILA